MSFIEWFQTPVIVGSSSTLTSLLLASSPQASSSGPSSKNHKSGNATPNFLNLKPHTNVIKPQQVVNSKTSLKPSQQKFAAEKTVVSSSTVARNLAVSKSVLNNSSVSKAANSSSTVKSCEYCRIKVSQFLCAGCSNRSYCSRGCQEKDWDSHCDVCA